MTDRTIKVDMLARVEGEGAFKVVARDGKIQSAEFRIFEPPRFFEAFLRGRAHTEAPDITARICGICPVAYQMSSVQAMEAAFGVKIEGPLRELRRLLYCGEWIESHVLHLAMLHAPDFLGYNGAFDMIADGHGEVVNKALAVKKAGNDIVNLMGGREIHPINVRVGGFYKIPARREFAHLAEALKRVRQQALDIVRWTASFDFPDKERDYTFVALRHPDEYAIHEGRIVSNRGLDIAVDEFNAHFREEHVAHSNALQGFMMDGGSYLCGPLARYNLNYSQLSAEVQAEAKAAGLGPVCRNPYQSIIVRALETLYAVDEAVRIIETVDLPQKPFIDTPVRAGEGCGATEAPRGILFHRYRLDDEGTILEAQIVPPTAQNQPAIEADLSSFIGDMLDQSDEVIRLRCEQTIRNYDPCISCATHFLKLDIDRG